mgnify:CR=1 FL=1
MPAEQKTPSFAVAIYPRFARNWVIQLSRWDFILLSHSVLFVHRIETSWHLSQTLFWCLKAKRPEQYTIMIDADVIFSFSLNAGLDYKAERKAGGVVDNDCWDMKLNSLKVPTVVFEDRLKIKTALEVSFVLVGNSRNVLLSLQVKFVSDLNSESAKLFTLFLSMAFKLSKRVESSVWAEWDFVLVPLSIVVLTGTMAMFLAFIKIEEWASFGWLWVNIILVHCSLVGAYRNELFSFHEVQFSLTVFVCYFSWCWGVDSFWG